MSDSFDFSPEQAAVLRKAAEQLTRRGLIVPQATLTRKCQPMVQTVGIGLEDAVESLLAGRVDEKPSDLLGSPNSDSFTRNNNIHD